MTGERDLAAFFDRAAASGAMGGFNSGERAVLETLLGFWGLAPGRRVLEVGCGAGRLSELAAPRLAPGGSLLALDISLGMLRRALPRCRAAGAAVAAASALHLPVPARSFHTVLWFQVFPHLEEPLAALREARRVLLPGGRLWISHLATRDEVNAFHAGLPPPVCHHRIPPDPEVRRLLESAGFRVLRVGDTPHGWTAGAERER